jgi:hypothetical protein
MEYLLAMTKQFIRIVISTVFQKYKPLSPSISASGYLYDPYLNDKAYPLWYWNKALQKAGFEVRKIIETGLFTLKSDQNGLPLTHFVCFKNTSSETTASN